MACATPPSQVVVAVALVGMELGGAASGAALGVSESAGSRARAASDPADALKRTAFGPRENLSVSRPGTQEAMTPRNWVSSAGGGEPSPGTPGVERQESDGAGAAGTGL